MTRSCACIVFEFLNICDSFGNGAEFVYIILKSLLIFTYMFIGFTAVTLLGKSDDSILRQPYMNVCRVERNGVNF